jgi:twitching motility two-component system response regulator PilG
MADSPITITSQKTTSSSESLTNPIQTLTELSKVKSTGHLKVFSSKMVWDLYLQDGDLKCASNSTQSLAALDYHFRCLGLKEAAAALKSLPQSQTESSSNAGSWLQDPSMNQVLYLFQAEEYFTSTQLTQLLENLTKEALESFLWLTEGHYEWVQGAQILSWKSFIKSSQDLLHLVQYFQTRLQVWQQLGDLIKSPHQRPYLFAHDNAEAPPQPSTLDPLSKLLRGLSIRQLALVLNQDELKVAKLLYPYIQKGDVYLRDPKAPFDHLPLVPQPSATPPQEVPSTKTYKIACIDDSPTILEEMQKFLGQEEYEVTKITDPVKAASLLFRLKPDLILMDITMPEINGYKLCGLLRGSVALRETPIIMVTGRTGLIDKARAKMTGATDYLAKPFTRGSLLSIVEKYLK